MRTKALTLVLLMTALFSACGVYKQEKELAPPMAEFLMKARYLMTAEERREFLALPDATKPAFVESFWKRRDPDPSTPENELRSEYEMRIESADKLFVGEGQAGYLTDRGRIYILYGPPSDRQTRPAMNRTANRCREVWSYANFPVVFVDQTCSGRFRLSTGDLTAIRELNIAERSASSQWGRATMGILQAGSKRFDWEISLSFQERGPGRIAARLRLSLPYGRIWFSSQGQTMRTTFDAAVEVRTSAKVLVYETKASFPISLTESEFLDRARQIFTMDLPIDIQDEALIAKLGRDGDQLVITVINATGRETQKKSVDFR
ncbi:MAG: GWxTD domain-containing protein [Acidobacteriota bacterium]|nr:GWxTD domain-containing protein [Acidobacteriota bacterium]